MKSNSQYLAQKLIVKHVSYMNKLFADKPFLGYTTNKVYLAE